MKKIIIPLLVGLLCTPHAFAAQVQVTWQNPEKYRDIMSADEHQGRFQERVFAVFEQTFAELAADLPADYALNIIVTDVDLAGNVELHRLRGQLEELRIIRPGFYPRMRFSYTLENAEGAIIQAADEDIRGREMPGEGRLETRARFGSSPMLEYERLMLERWFRVAFTDIEALAQNDDLSLRSPE